MPRDKGKIWNGEKKIRRKESAETPLIDRATETESSTDQYQVTRARVALRAPEGMYISPEKTVFLSRNLLCPLKPEAFVRSLASEWHVWVLVFCLVIS